MRKKSGFPDHQCCPQDWRKTPDMTGSFELDAMIMHTKNKNMESMLKDHLASDAAYQVRTAYNSSTKD